MAWSELDGLLAQALDQGVTTGLDLCVLQDGQVLHQRRAGQARRVPAPRPLGPDTRFDLASLTKPLVGAAVCCALIDAGVIWFGLPIRDVLDDAPDGVTVAHLLSHSAGYPAWLPLYEGRRSWGSPETRAALLSEATTTALLAPPGAVHAYSDVGFLVLCRLLEAVGGDRIDRLWQRRIATVAGWTGLGWGAADAAATEACPVRGRVIEGEVHDLNAAALGGASTHAGLFGTALAVARAGWDFLRGARGEGALASEALHHAWSHRGAGSHRLGWDGVSAGGSSSGTRWDPRGVGHLGFTGTSLWLAPSRGVVVVLLTNRVHPSVTDIRIRALRPAVHDAIVDALVALGRWERVSVAPA